MAYFNEDELNFFRQSLAQQRQQSRQQPAPQKKGKSFWLDQISTGTGIGGAVGGAALGTALLPGVGTAVGGLLGAVLGGGAASAGGEALENKITGDSLGKNVLKEGLLGSVTSVPITSGFKLVNAGTKAATGGALGLGKKTAGQLVQEAGIGTLTKKQAARLAAGSGDDAFKTTLANMASKGTLAQRAATEANKSSDNLAIKQFRLSPSQVTNINALGEDTGKLIRKYGFTSADDVVTKGIDPLQAQFDEAVKGIGTIPKTKLQQQFGGAIDKLKKAASSDNQRVGKELAGEVDSLLSRFGDDIDATELNAIRREFDSLVNYSQKMANPARYSVNKRVADGLRKTLQASDPSGSLQDVGRELQRLRKLSDYAIKQEGLGRGNLPLNLPTLLGGGMGAAAGGPLGAVGSAATTAAVNSPTGRRLALQAAEKATGKLATVAPQRMAGQSLLGLTARQAGGRLLTGSDLGTPQEVDDQSAINSAMSDTTAPSNMPTMSDNMNSQYADPMPQSNPFGYSSMQLGQALMAALAAGDTEAAAQLRDMYDLASEFEASAAPQQNTFSSATAGAISDFNSSLNELDKMEQAIGGGQGSVDPIFGRLRSLNPYDTEQQSLRAMIDKTRQIVGKALEGGVLRKEDEEKYKRILPTTSDSREVALNKIAMIRSQLQSKLADYEGLVGNGGGSAATDLTSALLSSNIPY